MKKIGGGGITRSLPSARRIRTDEAGGAREQYGTLHAEGEYIIEVDEVALGALIDRAIVNRRHVARPGR
jgi:hypothetical protein